MNGLLLSTDAAAAAGSATGSGIIIVLYIVIFGSNKNCRIPMEKSAIKQIEKANAEE